MKHPTLLPLCLVALLLVGCRSDPANTAIADVEPASCGDVKNMHRIGDLYVAGAVTPSDYPLLKDLGVKTILNIRKDSETPGMDAAALAKAQGIRYVHLPWSGPDELTAAKLDAMRAALRDAERPMLFHCGSANRVGAGWLAYRVLDEGVAMDRALQEAKTVGLRTPAYESIALAYIRDRQADARP